MKLDVAVNEITLSNVGATGEFKIRNSAKAFKILSDGLYSNKIRAIIRELSCNAVDSHVAAGKVDVPFEVHLPTMLEPWFSVKDFGLGLDGDQVTNIYTTYFESTKTSSNDFIGALGLGSKSPFSYTENFTVTAIKDGTKRIYSAFINQEGVPSIAEMSEELTDEDNGVEVKFSVVNKSDFYSFAHEAQNVFLWFKKRPIITGNSQFQFSEIDYAEKDIVPGISQSRNRNHSFAVMGNIAYSLSNIPEPTKHFGDLAGLLGCNLVIEFDIGDLDFAASREELSYIPLTINSIKKKLELLNKNLSKHISAKANAIENMWERAEFLYANHRSSLFSAAVKTYVSDTNFPLYDLKAYHGDYTFQFVQGEIEEKGITIGGFRNTYSSTTKIEYRKEFFTGTGYVNKFHIPVSKDSVFILNDLKTGCIARARYHYIKARDVNGNFYCLTHESPDMEVRKEAYNEFLKSIHNPPTVIFASELDAPVKADRIPTQSILRLKNDTDRYGRMTDNDFVWAKFNNKIEDDKVYYYVPMSGYKPLNSNGTEIDVKQIKRMLSKCGVAELENMEILGVRKNKIDDIKESDNWVYFEDKIREEIGKITDEKVRSLIAKNILDNYYDRAYISKAVAKTLDKDSVYYKFVEKYAKVPLESDRDISNLSNLCRLYGKTVDIEKVTEEVTNDKERINEKYKFLKYFSRLTLPDDEIIGYIKMVDKLDKQTGVN